MPLRFIAKDPNTNGNQCPTVWVDDDGSLVIQGWKIDDATTVQCLATGSIPETESVVRIPARMTDALRRACDVADGSGLL